MTIRLTYSAEFGAFRLEYTDDRLDGWFYRKLARWRPLSDLWAERYKAFADLHKAYTDPREAVAAFEDARQRAFLYNRQVALKSNGGGGHWKVVE